MSRIDLVPGENLLDRLGDRFRSLLGDRIPPLVFLGFDSENLFLRYSTRKITVPANKHTILSRWGSIMPMPN